MDYKDKRKQVQNKTFKSSFSYAIVGIKTAIKEEWNMKRHLVCAFLAIVTGIVLKISLTDWLWILTAIFLVIFSEIANTALENLVDLATDYKHHPLAKKAKDMMAGAVMIVTIWAAIVGCLIFIPKILKLF